MCRSEDWQATRWVVLWCPRPPDAAATIGEAPGLADGSRVARAARGLAARCLALARTGLASDHRKTKRLTPELSRATKWRRLGRIVRPHAATPAAPALLQQLSSEPSC